MLYALTLAARPTLIVEFGTSLGCSTIHLTSALRGLDAGSIITTELLEDLSSHTIGLLKPSADRERGQSGFEQLAVRVAAIKQWLRG